MFFLTCDTTHTSSDKPEEAGNPGPGPGLAPVGPLCFEAAAFSPTRPRSWLGSVEAGPGRSGRLSLACRSGETTASLLTLAPSPLPALAQLETGGAFLVGPLGMPGRVSDQQLSASSAGARGLPRRPTEKQGRRTPLVELRRHRPFQSMVGWGWRGGGAGVAHHPHR